MKETIIPETEEEKNENVSGDATEGKTENITEAEEMTAESIAEETAETSDKSESAAEQKEEPTSEQKEEPVAEQKDEPASEQKDEPALEQNDEPASEQNAQPAKTDETAQKCTETKAEENAEEGALPKKKKHTGLKVFAGLLTAAILTGAGYGYYYHTQKVAYYGNHFLNASCNGVELTGLTLDEAVEALENTVEYDLTISGRDVTDTITKEDIGLCLQAEDILGQALAEQDVNHWYQYEYRGAVDEYSLTESYDKKKLAQTIADLSILNPKEEIKPENAYPAYNEETLRYEIVSDTKSNILDSKKLEKLIEEAVENRETAIDAEDLYETAEITGEYPPLVDLVDAANKMLDTNVSIEYRGKKEVVDASVIKEWLIFDDEKYEVSLDEAAMRKYINANFDKTFDTKGQTRTFTSAGSGKTVSVSGGTYGAIISTDQEIEQLLQEIKDGQRVTREPLWRVTEKGSANDGIGSDYVEIDIPEQKVYVVLDGALRYSTSCVTGTADGNRDTPTGIYTVNWMKRNHHMKKYNVDVAYWMLFENTEGVGLHDATWRGEFGGNIYQYSGSHGCVNLPLNAAADIFSLIYTGIPVVVHK